MVESDGYRIVSDRPFCPGILVTKPSGRVRIAKNAFTGQIISVPVGDQQKLANPRDIEHAIAGLQEYTVFASGEWEPSDAPLQLITTDGRPFEDLYSCLIACKARPTPVSTSAWDFGIPTDRNIPGFGSPCEAEPKTGTFSNPWTGVAIEVPGAGCSRFWIEFEFGKFVLPKIEDRLDILNPVVVNLAEQCFHARFVQGCRFL